MAPGTCALRAGKRRAPVERVRGKLDSGTRAASAEKELAGRAGRAGGLSSVHAPCTGACPRGLATCTRAGARVQPPHLTFRDAGGLVKL